MKILLIFVAVPILAVLTNLRQKGFYQHHREFNQVNRPEYILGKQSIEELRKASGAPQPQMDLGDITGIQLIDKLLVRFFDMPYTAEKLYIQELVKIY